MNSLDLSSSASLTTNLYSATAVATSEAGAGSAGVEVSGKPIATQAQLRKIFIELSTNVRSPRYKEVLRAVVTEFNEMFQKDPTLFPSMPEALIAAGLDPDHALTLVTTAWNDSVRAHGSAFGRRITDTRLSTIGLGSSVIVRPENYLDPHPDLLLESDSPIITLIDKANLLVHEQSKNSALRVVNLRAENDGKAELPVKARLQTVVTPAVPGHVTEINPEVMTYSSPSLFILVTPAGKASVKYVPAYTTTTLYTRDEHGRECNGAINPRDDDTSFASPESKLDGDTIRNESRRPNPFDDCFYVIEIPLIDPEQVERRHYPSADIYGGPLEGCSAPKAGCAAPKEAFSHAVRADYVTGRDSGIDYDVGFPGSAVTRDQTAPCCLTIFNTIAVSSFDQLATPPVLRECIEKLLILVGREDVANIVASPIGVLTASKKDC